MRKRDELADPNSCLNKARDDELIFVLLERDAASPGTVRDWIEERKRLGLNVAGDAKLKEAQAWREAVTNSHPATDFIRKENDTVSIDRLTKRLLACSQLGIVIGCADGHRWIQCMTGAHGFNLEDAFKEKFTRLFNNKVYGSLADALNYIDFLLGRIWNGPDGNRLERHFDEIQKMGPDGFYLEDPSRETQDYFRSRAGF